MSYMGINIGALTVSVAALGGDARSATVLAHQGRPLEILREIPAGPEFADGAYFRVSASSGIFPKWPLSNGGSRKGHAHSDL